MPAHQLNLFGTAPDAEAAFVIDRFSHAAAYADAERLRLEKRYAPIIELTEYFSRQTVSFQANKTERLHRWMKYREGFSASLVETLLSEFDLPPGSTIFDPFAGSATTLLTAASIGYHTLGVELLPHCHLAWDVKSRIGSYDLAALHRLYQRLEAEPWPASSQAFPHLTITEGAFPIETEQDIMGLVSWIEQLAASAETKALLHFVLMSILESVSYTRKDGQYLRWDARSAKVVQRNAQRRQAGKKAIRGIDKGVLPDVRTAYLGLLKHILDDIEALQKTPAPDVDQRLIAGSVLAVLPTLEAGAIDGVITSPPYANRYDYTRTYALELAFLGTGQDIFQLRQDLLSCTVENRSKREQLEAYYAELGLQSRFSAFDAVVEASNAFAEVVSALTYRRDAGEMNNAGVITMIEGYFYELTFIFGELFRALSPGGKVAFVNDNVRYAGEIVPVDTLSTSLAEAIGFIPKKIYVIPQKKGNSSQQMKRYGRVALRKSITLWEKPA